MDFSLILCGEKNFYRTVIFRFGELRNNKELMRTEYILLGTFLSFTVAVVVGLLAHGVLGAFPL